MTQNEIILAVMQGCEKSRKEYNEAFKVRDTLTQQEVQTKFHEWERWTIAIDILNFVFTLDAEKTKSNLNPTRK